MEAPVIGAVSGDCRNPAKWQITTSYRHQRSDKHFVGTNHDEERDHEHSQVINTMHFLELGLKYTHGPRWSVSLGVPFMDANRSSALRLGGVIVERPSVQAEGIGDVTVVARRWMLEPSKHPWGNVSLGVGTKLPTGQDDVKDDRKIARNNAIVIERQVVDQSIQPGDGGLGFILDVQGYVHIKPQHVIWYGSATYLFNPECTDFVPTFRGRDSEKYMSIADQYLARTGFAFSGPKWRGTTVGFGGRLEGVPVHDVFGSSKWFRRPGYGVMLEPWVAWSGKRHSFSVAIPVAVERNRQVSTSDNIDDRHGDAAFADWMLLASWGFKFGNPAGKDAQAN
jgi:hypothetical protein